MKKLLFLVSVSILFFASCIPNPTEDPDPFVPPATVLLKKTVDTYTTGEIKTTTYTYDGTKLVSAISDDPADASAYYTYSDNLITKIEYRRLDGTIEETDTYEYDDTNRLVLYKRINPMENEGNKETYVYNVDGTVSVTYFVGDATAQNTPDGTAVVTFANGEISNIHITQEIGGDTIESTITYTYDNKNNPFKNVTGLNKIAFTDGDGKGIMHNITSVSATETGATPLSYNYIFTYANDFPLTSSSNDPDENFDTEYFY